MIFLERCHKTLSKFRIAVKRLLPLVFLLSIAPAALAQSAVVPTGTGSTTDTAYQITELGHLVWMHDQAATGKTENHYYKLMNDIDASATATWDDSTTTATEGFNPIGANFSYRFKGFFLGQGHKITGLFINRPGSSYVGLFGCVGASGALNNLGVEGGSVTGGSNTGGLAGYNAGCPITNCYSTRAVTGNDHVGGLTGRNYRGVLTGCHATGAVTGKDWVGGLAGENYGYDKPGIQGVISGCYATGTVTGTGAITPGCAGGLVGQNNYGTISGSYATGFVTGGDSTISIGGLAGYTTYGTISNCYTTCTVTGKNRAGGLVGTHGAGSIATGCHTSGPVTGMNYAGGIAGINNGTVTRCYATGAIVGTSTIVSWVGGLIGSNNGSASESYATGAAKSSGFAIGGLVGTNYGTIENCYATGPSEGKGYAGGSAGGLVGYNDNGMIAYCHCLGAASGSPNTGGLLGSGRGTVKASYWNIDTSGLATSSAGTGLTTQQMKVEDSFTSNAAPWDFSAVWAISGGYPYLSNLSTCTLTYLAGSHGYIADGVSTGPSLVQIVNLAAVGTPVTAVPNTGCRLIEWSDSVTSNPRTDSGLTSDTSVTALFGWDSAARSWPQYR